MSLDPSIICVVKGGNMILRRTAAEGTASFADGIWLIFPPGAADQPEAAKSELHREEF
jgi:hypothetical protein